MTSASKLRIGIVGAGAATMNLHLPAFLALRDVEVTCLCDPDTGRAEAVRDAALLKRAVVVRDPGAVPEHADAVVVASPAATHLEVTTALLGRGVDVLCEKPLARNAAEARRMIDQARTSGRILAAGMVSRFNRANEPFRRLIRSSWLGDIREVVGEMGSALTWRMTTDAYLRRGSTGGGVLFDLGIHVLDRTCWLLGPLTIDECADDSLGGIECNARLRGRVRMDGREVPARFEFSWTHALPKRLLVVGSKSSVELSIPDPDGLSLLLEEPQGTLRFPMQFNGKSDNPFVLQARDFVRAVRERRAPFVPAESTLECLEAVEAAYALRRPLPQPWVLPGQVER